MIPKAALHLYILSRVLSQVRSLSTRIPVGIFVDLDNVAPPTHSRMDARTFAQPLHDFAKKVGTLQTFQAFANEPTQTYVGPEEKERREIFDQEYTNPVDSELGVAQTGFDEMGILRCGVCGAKMKLSKKDLNKGWTVQDKLDAHMRSLHDREQEKRRNKASSNKKRGKKRIFSEKEQKQMARYQQAQVGLFRTPVTRSIQTPKMKKNDLFRVLSEQKIQCRSVPDVDAALERAARKWMNSVDEDKGNEDASRGYLVVVSEDSDFCNLLHEGRSKGFVAVSVTPVSTEQTRRLVDVSDLVLTQDPDGGGVFGELKVQANTLHGDELLLDMIDREASIESTKQDPLD